MKAGWRMSAATGSDRSYSSWQLPDCWRSSDHRKNLPQRRFSEHVALTGAALCFNGNGISQGESVGKMVRWLFKHKHQ